MTRYRLGFDIGGTFTDFVLVDDEAGVLHLHKTLTTPDDPSVGALSGLEALLAQAQVPLAEIGHLVHGTTLVTNAVIERRGCRLGLLTTRGFRDILEMGTEQRYDIHDLFLAFPEPLVPRARRVELDERVARDGRVVTPLDPSAATSAIDRLAADGVEAVAVCLLHAYKNPDHERRVRDILQARHPGIAVSLSSEVDPELGEYPRTTTTVINAYVQPLMARYVDRLESALAVRGFHGRFHLIQSSGVLTATDTAKRLPVRFLESGPAGGARATAHLGQRTGNPDIVSFDMGGTTAKSCLIRGGTPDVAAMLEAGRVHRFKKGSGLPVRAPVIDMIEIGAGGGSIARIDELGLLKVGPESAGADPGPACYGNGGTLPTVTDANLLLGYLDPGYFLGGRMALDVDRARAAMAPVADALGLSVEAAAWGVVGVVAENMAGSARVHIVEKGEDPRRFAMVAMGGAGPLHAAEVARRLGLREVVVPPASGAASALGFLASPVGFESARSLPMRLDQPDFDAADALLASLLADCEAQLAAAGAAPHDAGVERWADARLSGQMHEIAVRLPEGPLGPEARDAILATFRAEYERLYTHVYDGARIEIMTWRVAVTAPAPAIDAALAATPAADARKGRRKAWFEEAGGAVDATVYDRYALAAGTRLEGPAIVEEREATTIVPPGCTVTVDDALNLRLALPERRNSVVRVPSEMALADAVALIEGDPVGLEIMWSRLVNIAEECWHTVIRTAFSLIIGEAQDFACEILDARGRQLVHSPRAMPVFNLTLPRAINAMIERFPAQTLKPGDVLVTNDPWLCAGHLFDIAVAVPVFRQGRIVAFVGIVGHVADIGGTQDELNAREIYDEGLQIPPMKLYREGRPNEDLFELIGENVRRPEQVLGDIHALVSAGLTGARRLDGFMDEYGMHDLEALATVVQSRAESAMRDAIRAVPDGVYESVVEADGVDSVMRYPVRVTVTGDEIEVDFEGAPPQTDRGGSNCTLNYAQAHATYPLKCMFTPDVPGNAGCYRPMRVTAPKGSILNCDRPKAVNTRVRTGWYIAPNLFSALADAAPKRVQAFTGLPSNARFYGVGADGEIYSDHLFQGGGQGASAGGDGHSALLYPTSAANTSVEIFETRVPALVLEKTFVPDTGGPGNRRGGLGQVLQVRKLDDDGLRCQVGMYPNCVMVPIPGLFGGKPGGLATADAIEADGGRRSLGVGGLVHLTSPGQRVRLQLAGGAGFGDPWTRAYDAVQADLDAGFVTADAAARDYGCVVGSDGRIDRAASDRTRAGRERATAPAG